MRAMDALLVFPSLVLALAITAFLGVGLWNVILALVVTFLPTFAILIRGEVLSLREREIDLVDRLERAARRRQIDRHAFDREQGRAHRSVLTARRAAGR
jgi:peptide/nickel transport system permease protein